MTGFSENEGEHSTAETRFNEKYTTNLANVHYLDCYLDSGSFLVHQRLVAQKIKVIDLETRPDLAGRVAILQQSLPHPYTQDIIEANSLAQEAVKHAEVGGPNCHELREERVTIMNGMEKRDKWNIRGGQDEEWCGQTIFYKKRSEIKNEAVKDKFIQPGKLASQGGFITFFCDARMETQEKAYSISIVNWKSFRIKQCTINTLSAECQAMLHGVGALHWLRFLIQEVEVHDKRITLANWENALSQVPCHCRHRFQIALRHYDTVSKCCNTGSRIEDKRTATDLTILKRDFPKTQGQVRWIEGSRMISDSLTKKVGSFFLRNVMVSGKWSLSDKGVQ
ncbi:unnamed protein product [Cladocopium goreaui]|uniref:Uncharacterized protein n=1 Tax=Cladocopium goreaui TaxID=2562237 RepID=A0A9P1FX14_9DINO|nr:unnamed protein product [Cladocopium goreaui]